MAGQQLPLRASRSGLIEHLSAALSIFIEPAKTAERLHERWLWLFPLAIITATAIAFNLVAQPIMERLLTSNPPPNASPDAVGKIMAFQRMAMYATPLFIVAFSALNALITWMTASALDLKAKFYEIFNLIMVGGLIKSLDFVAGAFILRGRANDINSMAELRPTLSLSLFLPEGTNRFLLAIAGFFSLPEIWMVIMLVLTVAIAYRTSKMRAVVVLLPMILINLLFTILGASFGGSA